MKKITIKTLVLLLCFAIMASAFTACTPKDDSDTEKVKETSKPTEEVLTESEEPTQPEERTELYMTTWSNRPVWPEHDDNVMLLGLEEKFNVTLNAEVIGTDYSAKLNLLAASNDLPDIFVSTLPWDQEQQYARDGLVVELTDLVDEYLPEYKLVRTNQKVWDSLMIDGKLYSLPALDNPQDGCHQMRADWLEALGMEAPTTLDELHELSVAMTFGDPDGNGKDDTYAGGLYDATVTGLHGSQAFIYSGYGIYPAMWYDKGGELVYSNVQPDFKDALLEIRRYVDEGLFNTDGAEMTDWGMFQNDIYSGKYGYWFFPAQVMTSNDDRTKRLADSTGGGSLIPVEPLKDQNGNRSIPAYGIRPWNRTLLGINNPDVELSLNMLNWLISEEGSAYVFYGVEGVTYEKDSNGTVSFLGKYGEDPLNLYNEGWDEQFQLFTFRSLFGPHLDKEAIEGHDITMKYLEYTAAQSTDAPSWSRIGVSLSDMERTFLSKAFFDSSFDIEAEWEGFVSEWYAAGGDVLIKEINEIAGQ